MNNAHCKWTLFSKEKPETKGRKRKQLKPPHSLQYQHFCCSTNYKNNTFFPRTVRDWSELAPEIVQSSSQGTFILRVSSTLPLSSSWSVLWRPCFCAPVKSLLPLNIWDLSGCKQLEPAVVAALPTNLEHDLLYCLPCMCRTAFLDCSFLDLFNAKLSWKS